VLDAADQWHARCVQAWHELADRCLTTDAVVTEASHLVARGKASAALPLEFVLAVGIPIVALEPSGHQHAVHLMNRYANVPMDYADATLVVVADALKVNTVLTTDRRGFRAYRRNNGTAFTLEP
jgi:predicted nucleic acid-binding protein